MDCTEWMLNDEQLREWLKDLLDAGSDVIAPVEEDGVKIFRPISSPEQALIEESGKTRWSPKEFFFPRTEALYHYDLSASLVQLRDPEGPERPQVLVGVRSCDASGLVRLDEIFLSGTGDPLYAKRRANTTVVSAGCGAADPECFCTAIGGSPVGEEGCDVQLVPLEGAWMLRVLTEKGRTLVGNGAAGWGEASAKDTKKIAALADRVAEQIERSPVNKQWSQVLEDGFEHGAWDRLAQHCLGCSVCAYVCPSCSCFDMNHEANAWGGGQIRSWDACTFPLFTQHASGHNPRQTKQQRYRQRVLHKFAFRERDEDPFRCVGCGRCVALCPAGLDIVSTVSAAVEAIREEGADAAR
jgi:sulfhydrogenase subunit beta (sulfur reductase)